MTISIRMVGRASLMFLVLAGTFIPAPAGTDPDRSNLTEEARWLHGKAVALIRASRVSMADGVAAFPPQAGAGYDAFWLRDFAYQLEGCRDAFTDRELTDACRLFVKAMGPDGSGVDCVKFDGTPIYKPGNGTMGEHPVADGSPFTVAVAWHTYQKTRDARLLAEILDKLSAAMRAVPRNPGTGLVHIKPGGWDRCPYGFTDTVRKQGDVLFTSLLYIQACRRLAELMDAGGRPADAARWREEAERLAPVLRATFWDGGVGLFRAATASCTQPDIWGSAFAVELGVATADQSRAVAHYFKNHYSEIVQRGQIRHLPSGVYWDSACPRDTYQNGGYWATATGWFITTLDLVDPRLADQTAFDLVADFRERGVSEWVLGPRMAVMNYLASATMPLAGIRALCARRGMPLILDEAASVDLRPVFQKRGLVTRRQGNRGTCSAFALTGAIEFAVAARQRPAKPLSVEFLNWASNEATHNKDDGGFFSDLWKGAEKHGVCFEEDMPYAETFNPSIQPSKAARARARGIRRLGLRLHWIKEWDPNKGLSADQLAEVKRTLRAGWPVCGGFLWPKEQRWEKGLLQMAPRDGVYDGHSVLLVGYRDDPTMPGGGVVLIRNSAGPDRDGLLSYEYLRAYMNDAVWVDSGKNARAATQTDPIFQDVLGRLTAPPSGRNRRISSNEQPGWNDANLDMNWLQPGQVLELPVLEGPGVITHIWFTSHAGGANELNALSLRIFWDGRKEPAVEAPLGDFFAVGHGKPAVVESLPVQVSPTGALTCYWRMPFAKSARIVITNDNPDRGAGLYWQVDWVELDSLPKETSYFHAQYRREHPAAKNQDYLVADLKGSGQYVGTVLSVTLAQDGWFGEGDDFFFIDGETVPSLQGTGTEDYFNDAWGFRSRSGNWFGQPRWQGDRAGDGGVCYRWHVLDPVRFTSSLRVAIEHKGNYEDDLEGFYLERPDFLSSVAFWYQTGEPKRFASLPSWSQRRVPWRHEHLVRAFRQAKTTGSAKVRVQTQGFFGSRPLLAWPNHEVGARLSLPFSVAEDGRHALRLTALQGPEFGRYDILIDGKRIATADLRAAEENELDLLLGARDLAHGTHELTFQALDATSGAPGAPAGSRPLAVEMLRLLKLPPAATRAVKTHNEAHFVRLGIGRALYAYRLAYGDLPASLDALVHSGIMPARYLNDENGQPLKARREGDEMVVESPVAGGWSHRWKGLDPRR